MGGDAGVHGVRPGQAGAGESHVHAEFAGQAGQHEGGADVGEQGDRGFRHGEQPGLAGHPDAPMHGNPDAPAHADAVDQRHVRLGYSAMDALSAYSSRKKVSTAAVSPASTRPRMARMSAPAQKARPPAPSMTTALHRGVVAPAVEGRLDGADHPRSSAFRVFGRLSRRWPMRPSRLAITLESVMQKATSIAGEGSLYRSRRTAGHCRMLTD